MLLEDESEDWLSFRLLELDETVVLVARGTNEGGTKDDCPLLLDRRRGKETIRPRNEEAERFDFLILS